MTHSTLREMIMHDEIMRPGTAVPRSPRHGGLPVTRSPEVRTVWDRHELPLMDIVRAAGIDVLPTDSIEFELHDENENGDGHLEIIVRRETGKLP